MAYDINVIATGSSGNAICIDDNIIIDIGIGYPRLEPYLMKCSAIFVTHRHGDHFKYNVLKRLYKKRPALVTNRTFLNSDTHDYLSTKVPELANPMSKSPIMQVENWSTNVTCRDGRTYHVETYKLAHDVENQGFIITNDQGEKLIHATDTSTMKYAPRDKYDWLLIEGNWDQDKFDEMLESDDINLQWRAIRNIRHLSVQDFEVFVRNNSHPTSRVHQLHASLELGSTSTLVREESRRKAMHDGLPDMPDMQDI